MAEGDDEEPGASPPPPLGVIDGGKTVKRGPKLRKPLRITREKYDEMVQAHIKGTRTIGDLSRRTGVAPDTAAKAIREGWPERGWKPLKDHAAAHDAMVDAAARARAGTEDPKRAAEAESWAELRRDQLLLALGLKSGLAGLIEKLRTLVDHAPITEIKAVRRTVFEEHLDTSGRVVKRVPRTVTEDVEVTPNIVAAAGALVDATTALGRIGHHEILTAHSKEPDWMRGKKRGWQNLTEEQLDYIRKNNGKLPDGVLLEELEG